MKYISYCNHDGERTISTEIIFPFNDKNFAPIVILMCQSCINENKWVTIDSQIFGVTRQVLLPPDENIRSSVLHSLMIIRDPNPTIKNQDNK